MTLRTTILPNTAVDLTQFRAFCQMFHDNLVATGMEQTADTGQMNLATVPKPIGGTPVGYEIWRMTDKWATVAPVYIKVEYAGGGHVNNPYLWFSVGTGSDGAGGLTYGGWPGATSPITRRGVCPISGSTAGKGTPLPFYFVHLSDQSWALLAWPAPESDATGVWVWGVERFRDHTGATLPDGVNTFSAGGSGSSTAECYQDGSRYLPGAQQATTVQSRWVTLSSQVPDPVVGTRLLVGALLGTVVYPVPVFTGLQPRMAAPSKLFHAVGKLDLQADQKFSMEHYGEEHQWVAAGPGAPTFGLGDLNGLGQYTYCSIVMCAD